MKEHNSKEPTTKKLWGQYCIHKRHLHPICTHSQTLSTDHVFRVFDWGELVSEAGF